MIARVNADLCIGCELCVQTCPDIFTMTADGKAWAQTSDVAPTAEKLCEKAAIECPVEAIELTR